MTRKEQMQKLIDEETGIDNYGSSDYQVGVCDGVRLADKTMIEKACNWLKNIMYIQTDYEEDIDGCGCTFNFLTCDFDSVDEFIEYFKKAMKAEG